MATLIAVVGGNEASAENLRLAEEVGGEGKQNRSIMRAESALDAVEKALEAARRRWKQRTPTS